MSVSENRCLPDFLVKVIGRTSLKIWLKGYQNTAEGSSAMRNFRRTCSLKNQSLFIKMVVDISVQTVFERKGVTLQ